MVLVWRAPTRSIVLSKRMLLPGSTPHLPRLQPICYDRCCRWPPISYARPMPYPVRGTTRTRLLPGYYGPAGFAQGECVACSAGKYNEGQGLETEARACVTCAVGTFMPFAGASVCPR
eukprot:3719793-Rhodomonas_salina.2